MPGKWAKYTCRIIQITSQKYKIVLVCFKAHFVSKWDSISEAPFPPVPGRGSQRKGSPSICSQQQVADSHQSQVPTRCSEQACRPKVLQYWIHVQDDGGTTPAIFHQGTGNAHSHSPPGKSRPHWASPFIRCHWLKDQTMAKRRLCAKRMLGMRFCMVKEQQARPRVPGAHLSRWLKSPTSAPQHRTPQASSWTLASSICTVSLSPSSSVSGTEPSSSSSSASCTGL